MTGIFQLVNKNMIVTTEQLFLHRKYTEQTWKRYTIIIYILWESIGQKVFTKA